MRISQKLERILRTLYCPVSRDLLTSDRTEKGDYLSCKGGFMTYLPANKETDKPWKSRNRVRGKAGKIARNFCVGDHTDRDYEIFYNGLVGLSFGPENLTLEKGDNIMRVYLELRDKRRQSTMMASCMTGNTDERNFALYTENPKQVRLLVLWDTFQGERVAIGRCLIWKTDRGIYADRIYGSEPATAYLRAYIDNKGWMKYNSKEGHMRVMFEGHKQYPVMPYLDTFYDGFMYTDEGSSYLRA